jgi:hypothetical protein
MVLLSVGVPRNLTVLLSVGVPRNLTLLLSVGVPRNLTVLLTAVVTGIPSIAFVLLTYSATVRTNLLKCVMTELQASSLYIFRCNA